MASNQSASNLWIDDAFLEARREFLRSVSHHHRQAFAQFGTIEHVYDAITKIQKEQAKSKTLVALKRIEPYLVGLNEYVGVIDTFAQVKPEILCLIWVSARPPNAVELYIATNRMSLFAVFQRGL
jgi:hypothetical protein